MPAETISFTHPPPPSRSVKPTGGFIVLIWGDWTDGLDGRIGKIFDRVEQLTDMTMDELRDKHSESYNCAESNRKVFKGWSKGKLIKWILMDEWTDGNI